MSTRVPRSAEAKKGIPYEVKAKLASILGVDVSDGWIIYDAYPDQGLYKVHYTDTADLLKYGDLRGVTVDINKGVVVARSYGYTPDIQADLIVPDPLGNLVLTDNIGVVHTLPINKVSFKVGLEGILIYIFKHNGNIYYSTNLKIMFDKSRLGESETYAKIYEQLGGPAGESLFGTGLYSPYVHFFIISHPSLIYVTKDNIQKGFISYLGPKQMWDTTPELCPYPLDQVDTQLWVPSNVTNNLNEAKTSVSTGNTKLYISANLTQDEVNRHLRFGFYAPFDDTAIDPRVRTGEFIVIYLYDKQGRISKVYRVESTAYSWRSQIKDKDVNLLYRFYVLSYDSVQLDTTKPEGLMKFKSKYPILAPYDLESIKNLLNTRPIIVWPPGVVSDSTVITADDRLRNIWQCFILAVPLHKQKDVAGYYEKFLNSRAELITWLQDVNETDDIEDVKYEGRIHDIIELARKSARSDINRGSAHTFGDIVDYKIKGLIMREYGNSLYRLVKQMNVITAEKETENKSE